MDNTWKCIKCGSTKNYGYKYLCSSCYAKNTWINKKEEISAYKKEYYPKYREANRERFRERDKARFSKDDERTKNIIRTRTRQSNDKMNICFDCKEKGKTEFHHLSYNPNIFIELCHECHLERHERLLDCKKLKAVKNSK